MSDVRIDFPGQLNGFCPDVAKLRDDAEMTPKGRWRYEDIEFIAEVISTDTARNDYGPKKTAYALAEVPVYLIADPSRASAGCSPSPRTATTSATCPSPTAPTST